MCIRDSVHTYMELALDYAHAGLFTEAEQLLLDAPPTDPMVFYYLGWIRQQRGDAATADAAGAVDDAFTRAAAMAPDFCFPNQVECVLALQAASEHNPGDARAPYYLGNFWYAHRSHDDAIVALTWAPPFAATTMVQAGTGDYQLRVRFDR